MKKQPLRRRAAGLVAAAAVAVSVVGTGTAAAAPVPAEPTPQPAETTRTGPADPADEVGGAPTLKPRDGAYLEGTVEVAAEPTVADDSVTELEVDGEPLAGTTTTTGTSVLLYDVGSNSTEARYGNYVVVNDDHRIDMPDAVDERVRLEVPNSELVQGLNTITFHAGTFETSCGTNHDDFSISDVGLVLLGEVADGEQNEYVYNFGDGSCGSNTSLLTEAELTFNVTGDPERTTGLSAQLDTTALANGTHEISATTSTGATTTHTVEVNNAPAGAPRLLPVDGTLTRGVEPVFAFFPAGSSGSVTELTVDGQAPDVPETLAPGTATFSFDVGSNSIEARYFNGLLVNGHRVEIGGDWVSERVQLAIPNHFLVPGENVITVLPGDVNGTRDGQRCANLDDFTISDVALAPATGTATGTDLQPTYAMGDGSCGSSTTALPKAELRFTVDGADTTTLRPTLGGGEAVLSMFIGGNGAEARYGNYVRINGMTVPIGDVTGATVDLAFPNEWLHPGTNTVEVMAGTFPGSCGENYDDFPVSELSLTPASGTATLAMKQTKVDGSLQPIEIGDGSCGSSFTGITGTGVPFTVDAPAGGVRADIDTADLADGRHTIAATSGGGQTATRLLVTDNSAPEVASSTPADGDRLTEGVVFDAVVEDASGLIGEPEFLLDGEPIARGDLVGPGLGSGEHTIEVTASDSLGNRDTRRITFTSAGIPAVPTDLAPGNDTREAPGTVTLEARVSDPDGGQVTARFSRAEVVDPTAGFAGTTTELPTTLEVAGEQSVDVEGLTPLDGVEVEAPSTGDITFQRFDLPVPDGAAGPVVRWNGVIDPERVATLRVWDPAASAWEPLASSRGVFDGPTLLSARVAPRYVDGDVVHVLVTGTDPFADDMEPRNPDAFADPASYDFSLVHFTDTQYLSEGAVEQETEAERAIWRQAYGDITQWIADNAGDRKIAHVMHTGDIIENNINPTTPELQQQVHGEFQVASDLHETLDRAGIPSQVVAGNHDNQVGRETGPEATYNQYFGPDRYASADDQWGTAEYGGPWRPGDNQNNYVLFTAGGLDFVVVGLSYGVTKAEADWADGILEQHADRNAILLTHDYLQPSSSPDGRGGLLAPDGSLLYRQLVETNPNVFLILAGHRHGVGTNVKPEVGEVGNGVVELLADYQFYTMSAEQLGLTEIGGYQPTDQLRFGASFLRMLQFDVDRSEMVVDTYSPFLDEFGATEYDDEKRYDGTEDDMVLPVDLSSRATSFTTDSVSLLVPGEEIGTDAVASGEVASVDWSGLVGGTTYAWVVTAESAGGGRTVAEPGVFRTKGKSEPVLSLADDSIAADETTVEVEVTVGDQPVTDGEVELRDGDTVLGAADVVDGIAAVTLADPLAPGVHELVASYSGGDWVAAVEATLTLTVEGAPVRSSSVKAKPAKRAVKLGKTVRVAVRVRAGQPPATGRVEVVRRGQVVAAGRVRSGAVVLRWEARRPLGRQTYEVRYLGSDTVAPSSTEVTLRVVKKKKR